jgi:hypothetical protein
MEIRLSVVLSVVDILFEFDVELTAPEQRAAIAKLSPPFCPILLKVADGRRHPRNPNFSA